MTSEKFGGIAEDRMTSNKQTICRKSPYSPHMYSLCLTLEKQVEFICALYSLGSQMFFLQWGRTKKLATGWMREKRRKPETRNQRQENTVASKVLHTWQLHTLGTHT